jgi:D-alanyl-D-alanine carboxypeptidase
MGDSGPLNLTQISFSGPAKPVNLIPLLRWLTMAFVALAVGACSTTTAMQVPLPAPSASDTGKYAALVIDGNTGKTLYAVNAQEPRYPASLTKMMTLYLLFESMASGQTSTETQIPISQHAASQPPSKLRLRAGETIDARTAVQALATKSANDAAVAVGEYLGGTEDQFAARMTAKARSLGMSGTVFRNASGLPDDQQITTARDMAVLGMQLRKRFPQYFGAFAATDFDFGGRTIRGHNDMLGRVRGVNGIKTGYIRASGFNIVTSVEADGKRLIVVIMGGKSARARNAEVEQLIERFLPLAATGGSS